MVQRLDFTKAEIMAYQFIEGIQDREIHTSRY